MDKELVKLLERLCSLSDDDLIAIVSTGSAQYRPEVITLAKVVLGRRGFSLNKKGNIVNHRNDSTKKAKRALNSDTGTGENRPNHTELNRGLMLMLCPRCNSRLEYIGTRRLHEDKSLGVLGELGEMYKKGASELLDVYVCRHCGCTELFVDGMGEELRPQ
jgi:hypothetical protein